MKVVVTGANGFIGRNLRLRLSEIEGGFVSFDRALGVALRDGE